MATLLVAKVTTESEPPSWLTTRAWDPSGVMATPAAPPPTPMAAPTSSVAVVIGMRLVSLEPPVT